MTTVLFLTVGGSHQPIVTAIRQTRPEHVVFCCTDRDPATGKAGSRVQIECIGSCIKANPRDDTPTLPNIPTQCALAADTWDMCIVPADDLDDAYAKMCASMRQMRERFNGARLVADYTGGTKTMTAALVLAALDVGAELQVVTGTRADLVKVRDGTQEAAPAQVEAVRLEREMRPLLTAWRRFAYDEAAAGLESIPVPANARLRQLRHRALTLSRAFAAWDRFDHIEARRVLGDYGASLHPVFGSQLDALHILGRRDEVGHVRREGLRIWDLWLNARRRAAAGRYDDAVARAYRMIEWTAQWILESRNGWRTASLPSGIAQGAGIEANRDGVYQAGLYQAWALVAAHVPGPAAQFFEAQRLNILDHLQRRNASILAHGFEPVGNQDWRVFDNWLRDSFEPMLRAELKVTRIGAPFPQLPDAYPLIANHS